MTLIKTLPDNPHLSDVFKKFPESVKPLLVYHDVILRGESPFSIGERELIAAFVSGLNNCSFCFGAHVRIAETFGIKAELLDELLVDVMGSSVKDKIKPILMYVKKLTLTPTKILPTDVQGILVVGWSDRALHDAVSVCALFNFMNRFVEGMGVVPQFDPVPSAANRNMSDPLSKTSYQEYGQSIGIY